MILILTLFSVLLSLKKFRDEEFECAVCLEPCTDTLVNPECNHRFCGKCIKESLHKCNHECPTCRVHISTYRTCRRDPKFYHSIVSKHQGRNDIQCVVECGVSIIIMTPLRSPLILYITISTVLWENGAVMWACRISPSKREEYHQAINFQKLTWIFLVMKWFTILKSYN
jgi:hypothetical protein